MSARLIAYGCVVAALALSSGCDSKESAISEAPAARVEDIDAGQLFMRKCAHCHGRRGGGDGPGARSYSRVADLRGSELQRRLSDPQVSSIITGGVGQMPPVRGLRAVEVDAVVAYVRTLANEANAP